MFPIESTIEGNRYTMTELKDSLNPIGFQIGDGWDYDHGFFDYKIDENDAEQYVRIPFKAIDGEIGQENARVVLGTPFVLSHQYYGGPDEDMESYGPLAQQLDHFHDPENPDAPIEDKYMDIGRSIVKKVESVLT